MEIKDCFVIMPFSTSTSNSEDEWTEIFEKLFKKAWKSFNIDCYRTQVARGSITKDIIEKLYSASIVFADLTDSNPNVMYELGVRHSFKKPSVMVKAKDAKIPFDVSVYHVFDYEYTIEGLEKLTDYIGRVIKDVDMYPNKSDNPIWDLLHTNDFLTDYYKNIENVQRLQALKEEFENNLKMCEEFFAYLKDLNIPKDFKDWEKNRLSEDKEDQLHEAMETFYPAIRDDAMTYLRITRYISFDENDWIVFSKIGDFMRWCNCFSNNLGVAAFYEGEKSRISEIRNVMREGIKIIDRRISELQTK